MAHPGDTIGRPVESEKSGRVRVCADMSWMSDLIFNESVAQTLFVLCLAIVLGMALGRIRIFSVSLGVAAVLFTGLLLGHVGVTVNAGMIEFVRDFGLILFVYSIGHEVGPGFLASLRKRGLSLNLLAAGIVLSGGVITWLLHRAGRIPVAAAAGLFSGATTNTPSLAAIQQALKLTPGYTDTLARLPGSAYAMAYPFGVIGIILVIAAYRMAFRVDPARAAGELMAMKEKEAPRLGAVNLEVRNPELDGLTVGRIVGMIGGGVVVSRLVDRRWGFQRVPKGDTKVCLGSILHAVGNPDQLKKFETLVGGQTSVDLTEFPSSITSRRVLVTRRAALGKSVQDLNLGDLYGAVVTRIIRAGLEFSPRPGFRLQFGDTLMVVGKGQAVDLLAADVGGSGDRPDQPYVVPIFIGIGVGVLLGSIPVRLPGMAVPFRLGLAGGPLIASIVLSRIGVIGPVAWYIPHTANLMLRNVGIALFLACVGLRAGGGFVEVVRQGGLFWIGGAALISVAPLLLFAAAARLLLKLNFLTVCGLLAGSMTDPPALAFANAQAPGSDGPSVAFAAVYPLTMLLRVLTAQALILFFSR
jgi:putative transport protein